MSAPEPVLMREAGSAVAADTKWTAPRAKAVAAFGSALGDSYHIYSFGRREHGSLGIMLCEHQLICFIES